MFGYILAILALVGLIIFFAMKKPKGREEPKINDRFKGPEPGQWPKQPQVEPPEPRVVEEHAVDEQGHDRSKSASRAEVVHSD
ncbi:MAG: hypothetical protein ACFB21_00670 [Opitutales bacterium]